MNGTQDPGGQPTPAQSPEYPAQTPAPGYPMGSVQPAALPAAPVRVQDPRAKSPVLASVLSLVPGLGQIYVGYYQRGFIHAIVVASLISLLVAIADGEEALIPLVALFMSFFWLYNIIDAGRRATLYNLALAGGKELELPGEIGSIGLRGSIFGGAALIIGGFILLMHTRFGMPLEWVEDWWPLAPILFGAFLVVKAIQERTDVAPSSSDKE